MRHLRKHGYLYVARGQQYVEEAIVSANSLRKYVPDAHTTLITDKGVDTSAFSDVIVLDVDSLQDRKNLKAFKILGLQQSPYERTFFVDTDTYFADSCEELFRLLDNYDLLLTHAPQDNTVIVQNGVPLQGLFPYNSGVMVFRSNEVIQHLFSDWMHIYRSKFHIYNYDQGPLMEALFVNRVHTYTLHPIYNFRIPFITSLMAQKVKIFHGRPKNFEAIVRVVNAKAMHRVWLPNRNKVMYKKRRLKYVIKDFIQDHLPTTLINHTISLKRSLFKVKSSYQAPLESAN